MRQCRIRLRSVWVFSAVRTYGTFLSELCARVRVGMDIRIFVRPSIASSYAIGILILIAILAGCAAGPNFQTPDAPNVTGYLARDGTAGNAIPGQALARTAKVPERWWELFHS